MIKRVLRQFDVRDPLRRQRLLFWASLTAIVIVLAIPIVYEADRYLESDHFCGQICHSIYPEYVAYQSSPHAHVGCAECHIGPGLLPKIKAKIFGVHELYLTLTNSYERPIPPPVESLRPAEEICEQCHWPEKFYEDRVQELHRFAEDEANTETKVYLAMKVGGGSSRRGKDMGIHWHIENPVWYIATDKVRQEIPWVGLMREGKMVEYVSIDNPLTPEEIEKAEKRVMDCMDCHNRATHVFRSPERAIDEALASGLIDREIPYIKKKFMDVVRAGPYSSEEAKYAAIEAVEDFYKNEYPEVYANKKEEIRAAIDLYHEICKKICFPDMNLDWQTYPNNIGHSEYIGCFRCHDGRHFNAEGESIRMQCVICHSVPLAVKGETSLKMAMNVLPQFEVHVENHEGLVTHYEGPSTCRACHPGEEDKVMASVHYTFKEKMNRYGVMPFSTAAINWLGVLNEEQKIASGCGLCHIGGGDKPNPPAEVTVEDKEKLDCLICHAAQYDTDVRFPVKEGDRWLLPQDRSLEAAQSVGRPTVEACNRCHHFANGDGLFKRGLDFEACGDTVTVTDAHTEAGMTCVDCHKAKDHRFAGAGPTLKAEERPEVKLSCTSEGCHSQTPHQDPLYNQDHERLDCRTCHVTGTGGLMVRDVTVPPTFNEETGLYMAAVKRAKPGSVQPVYRWYDGVSKGPEPTGSIDDGVSKIHPFKLYRGIAPADKESGELLNLKVDVFAQTGDLEKAIAAGVTESGQAYSGAWVPKEIKAYFWLSHGVTKEEALVCSDCHGEEGLLDFAALGYSEEEAKNLRAHQ
ncbi:MAG TPA: hypothetical protein EYP49_13000 [Anaerolineae bacterium]|nr:hypothetical protein [Anaerolineae bacterium]